MDQKLLEFVQYLSKRDKKTLSQKALKTSEEVGELSKSVLSFDNAYATTHRFIPKNKILEEVADVLLTAMSVAYDLDFTNEDIEEMMLSKATKWLELQDKQDGVQDKIPYEIHVTVEAINDIESFKNHCIEIGVKPIVLDLQKEQEIVKDFMTSSNFFGDNRGAYEKLMEISDFLKNKGYTVLREKIETIPWHPAAPRKAYKDSAMPKNCYFESHISVVVKDTTEIKDRLAVIAKRCDAHLSKNFFKKLNDNEFINMVTLRDYKCNYEDFLLKLNKLKEMLYYNEFKFEKEIVEFAIYDTKISHDFNWINK